MDSQQPHTPLWAQHDSPSDVLFNPVQTFVDDSPHTPQPAAAAPIPSAAVQPQTLEQEGKQAALSAVKSDGPQPDNTGRPTTPMPLAATGTYTAGQHKPAMTDASQLALVAQPSANTAPQAAAGPASTDAVAQQALAAAGASTAVAQQGLAAAPASTAVAQQALAAAPTSTVVAQQALAAAPASAKAMAQQALALAPAQQALTPALTSQQQAMAQAQTSAHALTAAPKAAPAPQHTGLQLPATPPACFPAPSPDTESALDLDMDSVSQAPASLPQERQQNPHWKSLASKCVYACCRYSTGTFSYFWIHRYVPKMG